MPLFDPPRHDSAETIRRALNLGVNVKMITGECSSVAYSQKLSCIVNIVLLSLKYRYLGYDFNFNIVFFR